MMQKVLLVPESEKIGDRIETVRRSRTSFASKIVDEVIVIFDSSATRDYVFSHAKNLAKLPAALNAGTNSRGAYGLRLDYPAHLSSDYRALDAYGAKMRSIAGKGFKRNIRYNDDEMNLYMDVNFPGQDKWIRVSAKMAKEERTSTTVEDEERARKMIKERLSKVLTGANAEPVESGSAMGGEEHDEDLEEVDDQ